MPMMTRLRSGAGKRRNYAKLAGKRTRKPVAKLSNPIRKAVARVARRAIKIETKYVSGVIVDDNFNSSISAATECYGLIPQVSEGDANWQRNGTKIQNGYLYIKGTIQYDPNGTAPPGTQLRPCTVRLMMLQQKNQMDATQIGSRTSITSLLDPRLGTENAQAYNGLFPSNEAPINKKLFRVFADKKYKFNWDYQGNFSTAGAAAGNNLTKHFVIKIRCPKTLVYDIGVGSNLPTNFAPFMCLGFSYDDGTAPDFVSTPFRVRALSTMYFKDA